MSASDVLQLHTLTRIARRSCQVIPAKKRLFRCTGRRDHMIRPAIRNLIRGVRSGVQKVQQGLI